MKVVVPSKGREKVIGQRTLAIFPEATVCVDESEVEAYSQFVDRSQILPHPRLPSLGAIRNWIIDNIPGKFFMPDDDVVAIWCMTGRSPVKYTNPNDAMQIVENAAEIAEGIGANYFGFNQSPRPTSFSAHDPIRFTGWVGCAVGIIGKDLHYDQVLSLYDDVDFTLTNLLKARIVFADQRFHFETYRMLRQSGGNTQFRSKERSDTETEYLQKKWGRFISVGKMGNPHLPASLVKRRQDGK